MIDIGQTFKQGNSENKFNLKNHTQFTTKH